MKKTKETTSPKLSATHCFVTYWQAILDLMYLSLKSKLVCGLCPRPIVRCVHIKGLRKRRQRVGMLHLSADNDGLQFPVLCRAVFQMHHIPAQQLKMPTSHDTEACLCTLNDCVIMPQIEMSVAALWAHKSILATARALSGVSSRLLMKSFVWTTCARGLDEQKLWLQGEWSAYVCGEGSVTSTHKPFEGSGYLHRVWVQEISFLKDKEKQTNHWEWSTGW